MAPPSSSSPHPSLSLLLSVTLSLLLWSLPRPDAQSLFRLSLYTLGSYSSLLFTPPQLSLFPYLNDLLLVQFLVFAVAQCLVCCLSLSPSLSSVMRTLHRLKLMSSPSLSELGKSEKGSPEERGEKQKRAGANATWNRYAAA